MATLAKSLLASGSYDESDHYHRGNLEDAGESQRLALSSHLSNQKDDELLELFTIDEAVEKMGFGLFQLLVALFAGFVWVVEAFEVMILSILSAILKCEWDLSYTEEALITTVVFLGLLIGAPIWGFLADKYGRKKVLIAVSFHVFAFGMISAFAPNYLTLLLFRGLVGVGIGGGFLAPAYCLEFLPAKTRAVTYCLLELAWACGTIMEALLALVVMTHFTEHAWRWLLGFSAVPLGLLLLTLPFLPESPRYLIIKGKEAKAKRVLALVARINCVQMVTGRLVTQEVKEEMIRTRTQSAQQNAGNTFVESSFSEQIHQRASSGSTTSYGALLGEETPPLEDEVFVNNSNHAIDVSEVQRLSTQSSQCCEDDNEECSWLCFKKRIRDKAVNYYNWLLLLFKNGWWRTTLLLWYLWFTANVIYYGGTLLTTSLFQHDNHCGLKGKDDNFTGCHTLSEHDYFDIVLTTCAEFPGTIWIIILLLVVGRKKSMAITTFFAAVCFNLLFICSSKITLTIILFGIRGFASGFFQSIGLYTPEVYPTAIRAFGISLSSSFSRVGGMIAPFIAQTLLAYNFHSAIGIMIGISVLSSLAALLLPIETRGRPLKDSGG